MAKRILLAGILGGLVIFVWASVSHLVLGLGSVGVKYLPQEKAVVEAMRSAISAPGLYLFPGPALDAAPQGAHGLLAFHPAGFKPITPGQLVTELITNIVQALLAALLLAQAGIAGYGRRVGFVSLLGLLAGITTNISYWNWYGFPGSYTAASITDRTIGLFLAGLVIAALVKPEAATDRGRT